MEQRGTGHAALMELNYTPQTANGINIDKAVISTNLSRFLVSFGPTR
ncbi:malate:quinone oxidoreductase [Klebsiella michiganensis]|uniref:malate dehydrogenase (quinone) n=1 Tax=Klebsiella michiganensis TaxID=1134687 RepID=A0A7H4MUZ1_9ENTR|nr:malate:quinone oxidoreductase [Klebsiella michiganensis]